MSTPLIHEFLGNFHSRKLLLRIMLFEESPTATPPPPTPVSTGMIRDSSSLSGGNNSSNFDANVVMVLSVLLCALICSLGLNSIIRCALRCSSIVAPQSRSGSSARLTNKGVKKKALRTFPTVNYSVDLNLPGLDSECVICLSEFTPGERVRLLPKCHHGFHVRCIDKWLSSHSSCPTCRNCLIETCQKIVGCNQQASSSSSAYIASPENIIVNIASLEPEGLIRDYR